MSQRHRLDQEMVRLGLVESRSVAQAVIADGRVTVDGAPASKAARLVDPAQAVVVAGPPAKYVSRGGLKLEAALERFGVDVAGLRAIDVGSSTGGFTDCLLDHGVESVLALDVGRGQLHESLRDDPRVGVHERTNVRSVDPEAIGAPFDILVADLSFISLRTVMADLFSLVSDSAPMLLLVKPQFEAGKPEVDRGSGVIRDPEVWERVLSEVERSIRGHGAAIMEGMASPITGAEGNVEFLVHVVRGEAPALDASALVAEAVDLTGGGGT